MQSLPDDAWETPPSALPIPAPEAPQSTSSSCPAPPPLPTLQPGDDILVRWVPFFRLPHPPGSSTPHSPLVSLLSLLLLLGWTSSCMPVLLDQDQDGWPETLDCDDHNHFTWPGAPEVPYNHIDEDCSGQDLRDQDGDGVDGLRAGGQDCDDLDPAVSPRAPELCDGKANRCDGYIDDADRDGHMAQTCVADIYRADCDDSDPTINPFADEVPYDGIDQDCYGGDIVDADFDGEAAWHVGGTDCDDSDPHTHSGTERLIPAGTFLASPLRTGEALEPIFLNGFCMDRGEVTLEDYRLCVVRGHCTHPAALSGSSSLEQYYNAQANTSLPVVGVTLEQARTFCVAVGKQLPDPWSWQKAGRGGICLEGDEAPCPAESLNPDASRPFPWGEAPPTCMHANFLAGTAPCASDSPGLPVLERDALPAGASPYDVRHLAGNVAEWVEPWQTPLERTAVFGGAFNTAAHALRLESRQVMPAPLAASWLGFRCMRSLEGP